MGCACGAAAGKPEPAAVEVPSAPVPSAPSRPPKAGAATPAQFCGHCSQPLDGQAVCPACEWRDPAFIPNCCVKCKACAVTGLNFCPNCGAASWARQKAKAPAATPLPEEALQIALEQNPWPRGTSSCIACNTRVDYRHCPGCGKEDRTNSETLRVKRSWSASLQAPCTAQLQGSIQQQLNQVLEAKPYLASPDHFLNFYVEMCAAAIHDGDDSLTQNALDNLTMAIDNEERTVAVAFRMFDKDRSCKLDIEELRFMLRYIGFPSSEEDAQALMERTDVDGDRMVSYEEFTNYVGEMGGVRNLYRGRREQIDSRAAGLGTAKNGKLRTSKSLESRQSSKGRPSTSSAAMRASLSRPLSADTDSCNLGNNMRRESGEDGHEKRRVSVGGSSLPVSSASSGSLPNSLPSEIIPGSLPLSHQSVSSRDSLRSCGIEEDASVAWGLVLGPEELEAVHQLQPCQQLAMKHIRALAQENHERALPYLQKRATDLGFTDGDLQMALLWVRDLADIICHIKLEKVGPAILNDTHYRNQFETNTSSGFLKHDSRRKWEGVLFGSAYNNAEGFHRPKYGVQNILNDYRGVLGCKQYGDSYIVLKGVRLRCTCSAQDSALLPARRLAVLDFYSSALQEYSDKELTALLQVCKDGGEQVGDSHAVVEKWGKYKEVQIHGEIRWDKHISALVVSDRHRGDPMVERIREKRFFPVIWMEDMKERMFKRSNALQSRQAGGNFESLYEDSNSGQSEAMSV